MAETPTPRSYSTILSDMIDNVLSKIGLRRIKVGGPLLSILEAAAQSDFRATQDFFNLLDSMSIDRATGEALRSIASDENVTPIVAHPSTGFVTFSDSSFVKISSLVYQGTPAPNPGSLTLNVTDASSFPNTGDVYIGRNTSNFEGPIHYTAKVLTAGNYWALTLSTGTIKFHNIGETVILAQGGNRTIPAGTSVKTPQGNATNAISFTTLYNSQIDDGETEVTGVEVICASAGVIGNVPAFAIKLVDGNPYTNASATNPLPFTNGTAAEDDNSLRERIKDARQSRQKGTALAITSGVLGVVSKEDNKSVISSSLVTAQDETTLYIDDGLGYEETTDGIPQEVLMDSALGGERFFQLSSQRPIAKAFISTTSSAPFTLTAGQILAVKIGGVQSEHIFSANDFKSIGNATAFEVVASINGNPNLLFSARTLNSGTQVSIFAKAETSEDIEIATPSLGSDANTVLGFPAGIVYTLRLFKNDTLLYKDGKRAIVTSNPQSLWNNSIADGDTLIIQVDNTPVQTITFHNIDFISANTGFTLVSASNTLDAWATVINDKIPGVTATPSHGTLILTSNVGFNSRAQISITGGTLTNKSMFVVGSSAVGTNNDYSLDRNTGQLKLNSALAADDNLVVATDFTRGYMQSQDIPTASVTLASAANLWFVVDSNAALLNTGFNSAVSITITDQGNDRARYTAANNTFGTGSTAYIQPGDWFVLWDPAFADHGMWRISTVDTTNWAYFEVEHSAITPETQTPANNGFAFVRSAEQLQNIQITSGGYPATFSLTSLASTLNNSLINATASVYRGTKLRVTTNSYGSYGDIMLVTADLQGQLLKLPAGQLFANSLSHFAIAESQNSEYGTPGKWTTVNSVLSATDFQTSTTPTALPLRCGDFIAFRKRLDDTWLKYGANKNDHILIDTINGSTITARSNSKTTERLVYDRFYAAAPYATTAYDNINIILDDDSINKNYNINLFRNVKPKAGATYGAAPFELTDTDNSNLSLHSAFGTSTDFFDDFAFYMKARGKSHSITAHKSILWRFARFGSEGNYGRVAFTNPTAPSQGFSISTNVTDGNANINLALPSSAERTGLGLSGENYFTYFGLHDYIISVNTNIVKDGAGHVTVTVPLGFPAHNLTTGDQVYQTTTDGTFIQGPKAITSTTATSFTYAEAGGAGNPAAGLTYQTSKRPAGTTYTVTALSSSGTHITATIGAHIFQTGDTIYFNPGHYEVGPINITAGAKVVTSIGATTVTWAQSTGAGVATLVAGVSYTISSGQCAKYSAKYYKGQVQIGQLSRPAGLTVTAIIDTGVTSQPFQVGDIIYISPGEANFPAGPKIVTARTSNSITYTEIGAIANSVAMQYVVSTSTDPNLTGGGTPVIVGDVVNLANLSGGISVLNGAHRVQDVTSTGFDFLSSVVSLGGTEVANARLGLTSNMRFYPINTALSTAADVVSWINSNATNTVSATLINNNGGVGNDDGTAAIDTATVEEFYLTTNNASLNGSDAQSVASFPLFDGLNWVRSTQLDNINSKLGLKAAVNGELIANADFDNETIRLAPITNTNFSNFLNSQAISGLGLNALTSPSHDAAKLQIESLTLGSQGAVQILGGTGNQANASVIGAGNTGSTTCSTTINAGQSNGFTGGMWVTLEAATTTNKSTAIAATTQISVSAGASASEWKITATNNFISILQQYTIDTYAFQVEKQGKYTAFVRQNNPFAPFDLTPMAGVQAGDWIYIAASSFSPANNGLKRIVSIDAAAHTFLVDDPNGVEEVVTAVATDYFYFLTANSAIVGDSLIIGSNVLGANNIGTFPISRFEIAGGVLSSTVIYVSGSMVAQGLTTLGSNYTSINIKEGVPNKLFKQIQTININPLNSEYVDVVLTPASYGEKILATTGTVMTALDKVDFPNTIAVGVDGYKFNTGLIAEVNRVVYGDEFNPSVYPGLIASGANINISGPLVKRILLSLSVRLRTGVSPQEMQSRIKSAVAAIVNNSKVGESIAISDVVAAANSIDGVLSVAMLSPVLTSTNDLIPVQSNEKALVLNLDTDISVSIVV